MTTREDIRLDGAPGPEGEAAPRSGDAGTLSAREASAFLDVKLATLYAYTSRGLVRSLPGRTGRARRYLRSDLERLRARKEARSGHGPVAAAALRFGEPVLDTSISEISAEGPLYRGHSAVSLAESDTPFEAVAELLWQGTLPSEAAAERSSYLWSALPFGLDAEALRPLLPDSLPPMSALSLAVPLLGARDPARFIARPDAVIPRARHLIRRMAAALALGSEPEAFRAAGAATSVASAVALALGGREEDRRAVNRALVLCADHELNASAFAARVAASTGADLYSCIQAALSTLCGPRHGGAADRVEALIESIGRAEETERVVHERARRGERIEGFGHPLYPEGDPRGRALLELARAHGPACEKLRICEALVETMQGAGLGGATVDVGLVALTAALGLRPGAAIGLFAIGRCAGWTAHVLEQYEAGYLLRPRARYRESAPVDP